MKFLDCIFLKLVYLLCSFSYIELSRRQGVLYENKNQTCYFIITDGVADDYVTQNVAHGDVEKIDYLQKLSGYLLLGNSIEEEIYFLNGLTTRNGKTTFIETLAVLAVTAILFSLRRGGRTAILEKTIGFRKEGADMKRHWSGQQGAILVLTAFLLPFIC